jgi:hypothetical protein
MNLAMSKVMRFAIFADNESISIDEPKFEGFIDGTRRKWVGVFLSFVHAYGRNSCESDIIPREHDCRDLTRGSRTTGAPDAVILKPLRMGACYSECVV